MLRLTGTMYARHHSPGHGLFQACAVALLLALHGLWSTTASPVAAQPACASWDLTGEWSLTRTVAGANMSLRGGTLLLVHRDGLVVGRWAPGGGEEENLLAAGSFWQGMLRLDIEGGGQPLHLLLQLSSDGTLLKGRWNAGGEGTLTPGQYGELFLAGEAGCHERAAEAVPAAGEQGADSAACARWDLTGDWEAGFEGAPELSGEWRLHLVQSGRSLLGWYERAGDPGRQRWLVDGQVDGRVVVLTHRYAGGSSLERRLVLDLSGAVLRGPWPVQFGLLGDEVLTGQARCTG
jgi:hypothetical protein